MFQVVDPWKTAPVGFTFQKGGRTFRWKLSLRLPVFIYLGIKYDPTWESFREGLWVLNGFLTLEKMDWAKVSASISFLWFLEVPKTSL